MGSFHMILFCELPFSVQSRRSRLSSREPIWHRPDPNRECLLCAVAGEQAPSDGQFLAGSGGGRCWKERQLTRVDHLIVQCNKNVVDAAAD